MSGVQSMQSSGPELDPGPILQTAFAFWSSKVLLTAVEFGVFTKLGNRRLSGEELGVELGLHPRGTSDFFDALVAMRFLDREGDGSSATYFNTPASSLYLVQNSPWYVGGWLVMLNDRLSSSGTTCRRPAYRAATERNQARRKGGFRGPLCRTS